MTGEPSRVVDQALISESARQLREAAESGVPCDPVRHILGTESDIDAAYRVQQCNTDLAAAAGRRVSGHKIGLTARVVQEQLGVDQPDFGVLFADMCIADGVDLPAQRLLQPRAEAEIAVVLEDDLNKGEHCLVDIIGATAYLLAAIEIVDSRIANWDITIVDTVADNASCGLYVLGSRPVSLSAVDVRNIDMRLNVNGEQTSTGRGSACLGNPLHAVVWLANTMCERGTPLRAGECIMTGALGPMVPIAPGDEIRAELKPIGSVSTRLEPVED